MAEEQLIIEVKYEDHDAKKQIDDLTSSVNALNAATTGKGFKSLGHVAKNLAAISTSASNLDGIGRKLNELSVGATKVFDTFKSFDPKAYSNNIKSLTSAINSISNAVGNLSSKGSGLKAVSDALKQLPSAANKDIGKKTNLSGAANSAKIASKMFKDLGKNIKTVAKAGWELGKLPFKMILSPIQKVGQGLIGMTNRFTTFLKGIGRIALYRAIRTGIKLVTSAVREGVNNLYIWAGMVGNSFKPTMDSLATSFLYLKNSIGAAVSPLLDALAPAFEVVVNQIVDVLNIFNQVIATMTGASTWRKALRAPASYADNISGLGHDAEDASDAVKELKRTILGFDEINKLEDKTKTVAPKNNGKDPTGYFAKQGAFSFVEEPISQTALNIADKLKEAWTNGDFTDIGNAIGKKIGDALLKVQWEKDIQPAVKKLATSVGTLLNGLLDYNGEGGKAMWDGIAYTIYNAINTAVLGYTTFFDTVHWEGIGEGIGAALKKVCKNINWTKGKNSLGDALAAFPNAVIDVLTGFTKKFTAKDFYDLGNNVGKAVTKALTKIKWKDLFNNAITISTGILSAFNGLLEGIDWKQIKDAILTGIKSVPKKKWANLGTEIGKAIFNVADFIANMADTLIKAVESGKWKDLVKGIWNGLDKKVKDKYGSWGEAAAKLGSWIVEHIGTISALLAITVGISKLMKLGGALLTGKLFAGMVTAAPLAGGGTLATLGTLSSFLTACAIAIPVGITVTPIIMEKVDDLVQKFVDKMDPIINPTVEKVTDFLTNKNYKPNKIYTGGATAGEKGAPSSTTYKRDLGNGSSVWQTPSGDLNLPNIDFDKALEAARKRAQENPLTFNVKIDSKSAQNAWGQLSKDWAAITKLNKVKEFLTKGLANKAGDWWTSAKKFWSDAIQGKTAKQFTIAGIVNKAGDWWSSVKQFWSQGISGKMASRFTIAGIVNSAGTWWTNVKSYWSEMISGKSASKFTIGGVYDKSKEWWKSTKDYWNDTTSSKSLKAKVNISNASTAASTAFTTISKFFKNNPIQVAVQAVANAVTKTTKTTKTTTKYSIGSNGAVNLPTPKAANGGVYKDGQWHDVRAYAAGGSPMSGQMFIAREAGPELVGTIGGNTAVLNNNEIVSSVAAGVAQAVASVLGNGGSTNDITIKVDSEVLYRAVKKGERMASGRYGTAIAIG